jgi:hypothetical protein
LRARFSVAAEMLGHDAGGAAAGLAVRQCVAVLAVEEPIEASCIDLSLQTLMNMGVVARSVKPTARREVLSFKHHVQVASLPPDEQESWLDVAIEQSWSAAALREAIAQHKDGDHALSAADHADAHEQGEPKEQKLATPPPPPLPPVPPVSRAPQRPTNEPLLTLNTAIAMLNDLWRVPPEKLVAVHASQPHLRVLAMFFDNIAAAKTGRTVRPPPSLPDEGEVA